MTAVEFHLTYQQRTQMKNLMLLLLSITVGLGTMRGQELAKDTAADITRHLGPPISGGQYPNYEYLGCIVSVILDEHGICQVVRISSYRGPIANQDVEKFNRLCLPNGGRNLHLITVPESAIKTFPKMPGMTLLTAEYAYWNGDLVTIQNSEETEDDGTFCYTRTYFSPAGDAVVGKAPIESNWLPKMRSRRPDLFTQH